MTSCFEAGAFELQLAKPEVREMRQIIQTSVRIHKRSSKSASSRKGLQHYQAATCYG